MRALRTFIVLLAFGSTFMWADEIYSVSIWSNFTATQPCVTNCTETIEASFQYDWDPQPGTSPTAWAQVVPGTLSVSGNGFLGSVTASCCEVINGSYISLLDVGGDEIDLNGIGYEVTGSNIAYMQLWSCRSQACISAYDPPSYQEVGGFYMNQTYGSSVISRVPEPTSLALLLIPAIGLAGWRRKRWFTLSHRRSPID